MPQMAPLNWLMLMIYILMFFLILNSMIYFINKINLINNENQSKIKKINWKW
uniref:ATP synthase complex subunit 8 n=1 Tax=Tenebrionoidea sp. 3 KM-2017 TaxID=2219481 RepID=A0A346RJA6_9CUCU|nr:ATP synthase F0 subunit 8 [Tenebrionoidea sp. 3 KM-2017]